MLINMPIMSLCKWGVPICNRFGPNPCMHTEMSFLTSLHHQANQVSDSSYATLLLYAS